MADDSTAHSRSDSDELFPSVEKKAWATPQIVVQSIVDSTRSGPGGPTDLSFSFQS